MEEVRNYARITLVGKFFGLAYKAFLNILESRKFIKELEKSGTFEQDEEFEGKVFKRTEFLEFIEIHNHENRMSDETIVCVIFLSTFLEAYIWELGAIVLGDKYAKLHLDKLGTVSKWEIIPQLVSNSKLNLSDQDLGTFRELIKFRNDLVHHKSKDFKTVQERVEKGLDNYEHLHEMIDLEAVFYFVENLFFELDQVDPKGKHLTKLKLYNQVDNKK